MTGGSTPHATSRRKQATVTIFRWPVAVPKRWMAATRTGQGAAADPCAVDSTTRASRGRLLDSVEDGMGTWAERHLFAVRMSRQNAGISFSLRLEIEIRRSPATRQERVYHTAARGKTARVSTPPPAASRPAIRPACGPPKQFVPAETHEVHAVADRLGRVYVRVRCSQQVFPCQRAHRCRGLPPAGTRRLRASAASSATAGEPVNPPW